MRLIQKASYFRTAKLEIVPISYQIIPQLNNTAKYRITYGPTVLTKNLSTSDPYLSFTSQIKVSASKISFEYFGSGVGTKKKPVLFGFRPGTHFDPICLGPGTHRNPYFSNQGGFHPEPRNPWVPGFRTCRPLAEIIVLLFVLIAFNIFVFLSRW